MTVLASGLCRYGIMICIWCFNTQGRRQKMGNAHSCQMHQLLQDMHCGGASLVARHHCVDALLVTIHALWWCRGRAERMAFADSFIQAYHFRHLYLSSQMMYPIMGAMRHSYGSPWEVRPSPPVTCTLPPVTCTFTLVTCIFKSVICTFTPVRLAHLTLNPEWLYLTAFMEGLKGGGIGLPNFKVLVGSLTGCSHLHSLHALLGRR